MVDLAQQAIPFAPLRELLAYWQALRGDRKAPPRKELRPEDLKLWLGNISLITPVGVNGSLRFRLRLDGTIISDRLGQDLSGKYFEDFVPEGLYEDVTRALSLAAETCQPVYETGIVKEFHDGNMVFHRLGLPFSDDGSKVETLLVAFYIEGPRLADVDLVTICQAISETEPLQL